MAELNEPVKWDRTVWRGSDHAWQLRRVTEAGAPVVPSSARAQVRQWYGGELWLDMSSEALDGPRIDVDPVGGWITMVIPEAATAGPEWDDRESGVWDLEVVVDGATYRWAMGKVAVSQDVTREVV
jgi:hypothetical protein